MWLCLQVVHIDKPYGDSPPKIPSTNINYHRDLCEAPFRTDVKPLNVVQPEGACWTVSRGQRPVLAAGRMVKPVLSTAKLRHLLPFAYFKLRTAPYLPVCSWTATWCSGSDGTSGCPSTTEKA